MPVKQESTPQRILISRTDSIGDVLLTLPMCGLIKEYHTNAHLLFLGRTYTKPIIDCCEHIADFINWDEISKLPVNEQILFFKESKIDTIIHVFPDRKIAEVAARAGIKQRIGATGRLYHWLYCNKLRPLSRKNSILHEAELNVKLAHAFVPENKTEHSLLWNYYGFTKIPPLTAEVFGRIDKAKFNLILHPKSKGSAREWPLDKYKMLVEALPPQQYNVFISGTSADGEFLQTWLKSLPDFVHDITGQLSLSGFIAFIGQADGLIAASTGPLHIAAALGKMAIGLYPPIRPMHPGRWGPIGKNAHYIVLDKNCSACKDAPLECRCMKDIEVEQVLKKVTDNAVLSR